MGEGTAADAKKSFTLIVVPDHSSAVRRYHIQKRFLLQCLAGVGVRALIGIIGAVRYFQLSQDAAENRILRDENLARKGQLKSIRERIDHIGSTLDRVERFDQKLRAITDGRAPVGRPRVRE